MAPGDPTRRFTDRVRDYARCRPDYPAALLPRLAAARAVLAGDVVADLGAGTGKLAERFLERGHRVVGVEPNLAMAAEGRRALAGAARFAMVAGRAEATGLAARSVDLVAAGQAFHWFDRAAARREALRILRPAGRGVLVWNVRASGASRFMAEYEALLRAHGTDYELVSHEGTTDVERNAFFGHAGVASFALPHFQALDRDGLRGRLLSSSYVPPATDPRSAPMLEDLDALFATHAVDGLVRFEYETRAWFGPVAR